VAEGLSGSSQSACVLVQRTSRVRSIVTLKGAWFLRRLCSAWQRAGVASARAGMAWAPGRPAAGKLRLLPRRRG
jgi:hypothetical protein